MKVLIVVDMQNDFIDGALGTPEAQAIVPNVKKKIDEAVKNGDCIVYTRDTHYNNGADPHGGKDYLETREGKKLPVEHCIYGTDGWQIPDMLMPEEDYKNMVVLDKRTFGMYSLPEIIDRNLLNSENDPWHMYDEIELVGLCTDICVVSNAMLLKAYFYGSHEISVDASCCAGVTPETHKAALQTMKMCQINVIGE